MNEIIIASTTTIDRLDKVYILLNSIKKTKETETKILYYLFVQYDSIYNKNTCVEYFKDLISKDFILIFEDASIFKGKINPPVRSYIYYIKCLFPDFFKHIPKILYLDVDLVFYNKGIEDLWNTDLEDNYIAGVIDPTWQFCAPFSFELNNTKTKKYINTGVVLFNLDEIRRNKKNDVLRKWLFNWDLSTLADNVFDQTLLNYVLRDKIKLIDFKYNNTLLISLGVAKDSYRYYLNEIGYENPIDCIDSAVILHFCGANKPWDINALNRNETEYPYKKESVEIWSKIETKYSKKTNMNIINTENVKIDWSKYVDAIYCLHYIPHKDRLKKLVKELKYFDILDSNIFSWYLSYPNAFDEIIANYINPVFRDYHNKQRTKTINLTLAYHNMFREIQELGFNKVLIIENDCTFVHRRKKMLLDALEHLPKDWDYIQFDKVRTLGHSEYFNFLNTVVDGDWFYSNYTGGYWGNAFTLWSKKAIDIAIEEQEKELTVTDHLVVNRYDKKLDTLNRFVPRNSFVYQPSFISFYDFT